MHNIMGLAMMTALSMQQVSSAEEATGLTWMGKAMEPAETISSFFAAMENGEFTEAVAFCTADCLSALPLLREGDTSADALSDSADVFAALSDDFGTVGLDSSGMIADNTQAMRKVYIQDYVLDTCEVDGDQAKVSGKALQVKDVQLDMIDLSAVSDDALAQYAKEHPIQWAKLLLIQDEEEFSREYMRNCVPYINERINEAYDDIDAAWYPFTMMLAQEDGTWRITSTDLDMLGDEKEWIKTPVQTYWCGDWYGWWIITDASGKYAEENGAWYDACAHIFLDEEGNGRITLWDEWSDKEHPLGTVRVRHYADEAIGEYGALVSQVGQFFGGVVLEDQWFIPQDPFDYPHMITIEGENTVDDGSLRFSFYLRPWGMLWDDAVEEQPYYYESWYLPLVAGGEAMPDEIAAEE